MDGIFTKKETKIIDGLNRAAVIRKILKFTKKEATVGEMLLELLPVTDCQPVGQRLSTETSPIGTIDNPSKAQGIICAMFVGIDIGAITLTTLPFPSNFTYESVDGGHRKRAIKSFFNNEFPLPDGTFFKALTELEKEFFLNYGISLVIYDNLSTDEKGYVFRTLNKTTDVNHQEMLNSYGNIAIANLVRNTVRIVKGVNSTPHILFKMHLTPAKQDDLGVNETQKEVFNLLSSNNLRLKLDAAVARIVYRLYKDGNYGVCDDKSIQTMYDDADLTQDKVDKIKGKLDELLTFIANIADARKMGTMKAKNGLPFGEFILLSRLFLYMENTFNSYSINSYDDFYMGFKAAFDFWNNKEDKLTKKAINFDWDKRGLTIGEAFTKYNSGYDSFKKQYWTINWLLEKFDITRIENPYITLKDPTRSLPEKQREAKLSAQNFICAVDGKKLSMKDAVAAHVISHANGGRTTWDNIVMVRKSHNVAMGTMDLNSYKELLKSMGKI